MRPFHLFLILNAMLIFLLVAYGLAGIPRHLMWKVALISFVMVNLIARLAMRRALRLQKQRDK